MTPVLGRLVEHDERSKAFPAAVAPGYATVYWKHHAATLDQGQIGSCTGNAMAQCLGTEPLWHKGVTTSEAKARRIYSLATKLDDVPGEWPPTDTGSSGLGVAKAAQQLGFIRSYTHAFGVDHALGAIQVSPFIAGTEWTQDMFNPTPDGFVHPTGKVAGGHEYLAVAYEADRDCFVFLNSWGRSFGVAIPEASIAGGAFRMTRTDFAHLLNQQGDITVPVV